MNPTRLRSLINPSSRPGFFQKINLWDIVDDVAVGVDLQMSAVLELMTHPDVLLKGPDEIEMHLVGIRKLLHSVQDDITLQFVVRGRLGDSEKIDEFVSLERDFEGGGLASSIIQDKEKYLKSKFVEKKRYFLFITSYANPLDRLPSVPKMSLKDAAPHAQTEAIHQQRIAALRSTVTGVMDTLRGVNVKARRLNNQEIAAHFYEYLNPSLHGASGVPDLDREKASGFTARSLLARTVVENNYDHVRVDQYYVKGVNMLLLPESVQVDSFHAMMSELWPDYDICLSVHCVNSDRLLERLKRSANVTKTLSFSNFGSRYEATQKYEELDELIREIRATTQRLFTISMNIVFRDTNRARLDENAVAGVRAFQSLGSASAIVDNMSHEDLFLSTLPNHSHFNTRTHVIHTDPLSKLVPLTASWKGTSKAKMLFENPGGELVSLDMFDPALPAKHALVIGTTGAGKSFTTNYLLTNFFIESVNNHIVIIDIGGSYRKMAQVFGGQYLNVELSDRYAFNPLPDKRYLFDGKEYDPDEIAYISLILERMVLDQEEVMQSLGESIIEKALKHSYEGLGPDQAPLLQDVRESLLKVKGDEETQGLARHYYKNLEMWTEGRYSKVFNSSRRLQLDNRLIVFDLERLGNHPRLQSVYFYVIREIIDSKLREQRLQKMIVIDEGHRFFDDDIGSRLIDNLYRTARKRNAAVLSISQSPVDFLKTKAATGIITNSYVKYILRLTKGHDLLPQFGLTNSEIEAVRSLTSVPRKFSDIFLKFAEEGTVLRLEPSPLDYWICTTDPQDALAEEKIRTEHPDWGVEQVLLALAETGKGGTK